MNRLLLISFFLLCSLFSFAQDEDNNEEPSSKTGMTDMKGFHGGFYVGAFFANNYSASLYDGHGIDPNTGTSYSFINSVMVQRMASLGMDSVNCPSLHGSNYTTDLISPAIGPNVSHDQWSFDSTDMPSALKYNVAFLFGLNLQYGINKSDGIILNVNFAKITVTGTFTITTHNNVLNPSLGDSVLYFGVSGQEQRFMFQLGYSKVLGDPAGQFNFMVEGGLLMNSAKWLSNAATINNLKIDLTPFSNNQGYLNNYVPAQYNAIGYGAFAGIGFNINLNSKYFFQVLYSPSLEKINTGDVPTAKLQQAAGLRVYYNF